MASASSFRSSPPLFNRSGESFLNGLQQLFIVQQTNNKGICLVQPRTLLPTAKGGLWDFGLRNGSDFVGRRKACSVNQAHKLSYRVNTKLLHHAAAVDFHGLLRGAQLARDLFV